MHVAWPEATVGPALSYPSRRPSSIGGLRRGEVLLLGVAARGVVVFGLGRGEAVLLVLGVLAGLICLDGF